jgi:hypothetical protein
MNYRQCISKLCHAALFSESICLYFKDKKGAEIEEGFGNSKII